MRAMERLSRPVLLYDGDCRLCRFAARAVDLIDRGRRVALLPLEDGEARQFVRRLPEEKRFASWHLVEPDGRITSGGAAAARLLDSLGHARAMRGASRLAAPVERLYDLVATHRSTLGRFLPDGKAPRRFP
jgi:predicted DCC family thiol-disulfide oxidoreductase YuxK